MAHVLVIDSDAATRTMVEQTLRPAGHVVLSATNAGQGVDLYRTTRVDVAIVCLYLPNESGMNTVVDCLYESPGVEIMAFGSTPGVANPTDFAHWRGASKSIAKPVDHHELIKAVKEVLRARNSVAPEELHPEVIPNGTAARTTTPKPTTLHSRSRYGQSPVNRS